MLQIDFPSTDTYFSFTSVVDSATITFVMQWMTRTECWYLSMYDSSSNLLVSNIKLVTNFPLLYQKTSIGFTGNLVVYPTTTATELTADNLSSDFTLIYLTEDEMSGE